MGDALTFKNMIGVHVEVPESVVYALAVRKRTEGRLDEYGWHPGDPGPIPGGCSWMSEEIALIYGWQENGGCYIANPFGMDGEPGTEHIAHCWNNLLDGRILDTTADQFGAPGDGVVIVPANDPRYNEWCDCDTAL